MVNNERGEGGQIPGESGPSRVSPRSADFSPLASQGSVLDALDADLAGLRTSGGLRPGCLGLVEAARRLAARIDTPGPDDTLSMMASALREIRATLAGVMVEVTSGDDEEFFGGLTAVSATVRDPKELGPSDVGRQGRRGDGGSRLAADAVAAARPGRRP